MRARFQERGVRHGALSLTPVEEETEFHAHRNKVPHCHSDIRIRGSL
ncbi:MAG: hypothetical protein MUF73_17535 [Rhodobacteraceae bacterium]|jgi:CopG family nickel-responsive transcriptional regulator|nr:hypothetical protein [Paracoccaceae bacterium]